MEDIVVIGLWIVFFGAILALNIWLFSLAWQKGRRLSFWCGIAGILVPFVGLPMLWAPFRIGRPDSPYALKHYGPEKMTRSLARFGTPADKLVEVRGKMAEITAILRERRGPRLTAEP